MRWSLSGAFALALLAGGAGPAGAATTLTAEAVEVEETGADGFVTTYDGSVVNTTVMLRTASTGADGAPAAAAAVTIYRCPATRRAACRTADPAATAGWRAVANGVTDATGAFAAPLKLAESGWYAAALDGVPGDSAGNAVLPAFIGGRSHWSIARRHGKPFVRVTGRLDPVVPAGSAWVVLQIRKKRSGPGATFLRLRSKANGKFSITVPAHRGSWSYRVVFTGRPKDRYANSYSNWHRYSYTP